MKKIALFALIGLCFLALPVRAQINLLHEFAGGAADGGYPWGDLIVSGSTLYGMTESGGASNAGTIFKIETAGSGYALLHEFAGGAYDGASPQGAFVISGSTLYGMTPGGGDGLMGTIFKIETDGSGFSLLHEFAGGADDGAYPYGSLIISGSTLYGMTPGGGDSLMGTIFRIETDGSGFSLLHEFAADTPEARSPEGSLVISGSTLYGMTRLGGNEDWGTIFQIQTDGSDFGLLHVFTGGADDGGSPYGSLIISGSSLYGMTSRCGDADNGAVFKMLTNGTGYILLHKFAGGADDGVRPYGSLVFSGPDLYGMTCFGGGDSNLGTLFKMQTDGSGFSLLHKFAGEPADGASPNGSLILSGSTLFGMTRLGGGSDFGVVFSLMLEGETHIISGTVRSGGTGLADVLMSGLPGNPVTDSSGFYSTVVDHGWSGTVTPARQYFTFTPASTTYTGVGSDQTTDYSASLVQSLVVTAPSSASIWERGRTYAITWLKQGDQNATVKIELYKNTNTLVKLLAATTPNNGAFYWQVPTNLATGSAYFVRVRTVDNLIYDDSDKFSIIVPSITITAPTTGNTWIRGATENITWTSQGMMDASVKIQLYKGTAKVLDIATSTPTVKGIFTWTIPDTLAQAKNYSVKITTFDNRITGKSGNFSIVTGIIGVTSPATGALWQRGMAHAITWSWEGLLNANVRIQLVKGDQVSTIVATTANDGSFDWIIPANRMLAANYRIRVTTVDNQVTAQSGLFAITNSAN